MIMLIMIMIMIMIIIIIVLVRRERQAGGRRARLGLGVGRRRRGERPAGEAHVLGREDLGGCLDNVLVKKSDDLVNVPENVLVETIFGYRCI